MFLSFFSLLHITCFHRPTVGCKLLQICNNTFRSIPPSKIVCTYKIIPSHIRIYAYINTSFQGLDEAFSEIVETSFWKANFKKIKNYVNVSILTISVSSRNNFCEIIPQKFLTESTDGSNCLYFLFNLQYGDIEIFSDHHLSKQVFTNRTGIRFKETLRSSNLPNPHHERSCVLLDFLK